MSRALKCTMRLRERWLRMAAMAACLGLAAGVACAQQTILVTNNNPDGTGSMLEALNAATLSPGPFTIEISAGLALAPTSMYFVAASGSSTGQITINGNGATIDMSSANGGLGDRAFFIASGTVAINNLSIINGRATGGNGVDGGGGGAGLGGAIFVANSQALTGPNLSTSLFTFPTSVTLRNVSIASSQALGGSSLAQYSENIGGGGGMGGNGGFGARATFDVGAGGGGGFGVGANGGTSGDPATNGATGAFANYILPASGTTLAGGDGGTDNTGDAGGSGGLFGGGGGGAKTALSEASGGGGGVGGGDGLNYFTQTGPGGAGGFGGGGGGGASVFNGGAGGFGGGGGGSRGNENTSMAGAGGFGGGGGGGTNAGGGGGFGAGNGASGGGSTNFVWQGGGGLGAGGGIFVMPGASLTVVNDGAASGTASFSGNSVTSGTGGFQAGSAYGADLFLGANVTFNVSGGRSLAVASLGGAGNLADPNVSNDANDPNAQGGIIKTGNGLLTLTGTSYYSGITTVNSGTLALAAGAKEQGTTVVTVGQNAGDVATLALGSSSSLNLRGFNGTSGTDSAIMIAQVAGSTGTVVIGSGAGSSGAGIGAREVTGGAGNATVRFTQQYAAGSGSDSVYPFFTTLTGTLGIVQEGAGTTLLEPLYGANTFSGPVIVNSGTLATTGSAAALAGATSIAVNAGGALALGQNNGIGDLASLTLAGGILQTGTNITEILGGLSVTGASRIDFLGDATLVFSSLTLSNQLAIWNYSNALDYLEITTGTATGSLSQIAFYSDAGQTYLGEGGFDGARIVPVPEPATLVLTLGGLAYGGLSMRRRRRLA